MQEICFSNNTLNFCLAFSITKENVFIFLYPHKSRLQPSFNFVKENVFIFLPKPHYLKRKVCNPLGIKVTSFEQYSNISFQVFKENVFIFLAQANVKRKVCYPLGISHSIQLFVKENMCVFLPIKYCKRKVCNPLGKSHYTNHLLKKMYTFSWPSHILRGKCAILWAQSVSLHFNTPTIC